MSTRLIIGVVSFCVATSGVILANMFLIMMVGEINRKRKEGDLISYFGYTPAKTLRIFREYRNCYPGGRLLAYSVAAFVVATMSAIVVAVCIRII